MIRRVVVCDECFVEAETADGIVMGANATSVRTQAKDNGWRHSKGRDLCSDCWEEGTR